MVISEVIKLLVKAQKEFGDIDVITTNDIGDYPEIVTENYFVAGKLDNGEFYEYGGTNELKKESVNSIDISNHYYNVEDRKF